MVLVYNRKTRLWIRGARPVDGHRPAQRAIRPRRRAGRIFCRLGKRDPLKEPNELLLSVARRGVVDPSRGRSVATTRRPCRLRLSRQTDSPHRRGRGSAAIDPGGPFGPVAPSMTANGDGMSSFAASPTNPMRCSASACLILHRRGQLWTVQRVRAARMTVRDLFLARRKPGQMSADPFLALCHAGHGLRRVRAARRR